MIALCSLAATSCMSFSDNNRQNGYQVVEEGKRLELRRLRRAGFDPLADAVAAGIEVQRVDPTWGLLDHPSVELTRDKLGTVTVALKFQGHERRAPVSPTSWTRLADLAHDAFNPVEPRALEAQDRRVTRKSGYCHGWNVIEANIAGRQSKETVSACAGTLQKAGYDYSMALIRLAIDNIDLCEPHRQTASIQTALFDCGLRFGRPTPQFLRLE